LGKREKLKKAPQKHSPVFKKPTQGEKNIPEEFLREKEKFNRPPRKEELGVPQKEKGRKKIGHPEKKKREKNGPPVETKNPPKNCAPPQKEEDP